MLISVLYVGKDAPEDWTKVDRRASMAVLSFEEFKLFAASHSGKIYATPETQDCDEAAWANWLAGHNRLAGQYQNWELG